MIAFTQIRLYTRDLDNRHIWSALQYTFMSAMMLKTDAQAFTSISLKIGVFCLQDQMFPVDAQLIVTNVAHFQRFKEHFIGVQYKVQETVNRNFTRANSSRQWYTDERVQMIVNFAIPKDTIVFVGIWLKFR